MKTKPSILVIDDEQVICDSCHRILSGDDIRVDTDTSPENGLKKAVDNDYDLILLDICMEEMNGMQLLSN
ncbi:MAG: response regulator, partial [Bacteroidota bacterium]